jgi:hypothetical protein
VHLSVHPDSLASGDQAPYWGLDQTWMLEDADRPYGAPQGHLNLDGNIVSIWATAHGKEGDLVQLDWREHQVIN